jgi:prepilin-type N-terminal cleavage/methylation domain-containing protein
MKKQSGFALVELLLVLAIIAILTAIATPTLLNQRARARDKAAMANADALIADLVAGYDRCLEAGTNLTSNAVFEANVLGTATNPLVPIFFNTRNPWGTTPSGYAPVVQETNAQGAAVVAAAIPNTMGQVQVGFLPRNGAQAAALTIAVYLHDPIATLVAAAPASNPAPQANPPAQAPAAAAGNGATGGGGTGSGPVSTPTNHFVKIITLG